MKTKISLVLVLALMILLPTVAIAQAIPLQETNNEKFQPYSDGGTYNLVVYRDSAVRTYVPSFDEVNKLVVDVDELFTSYTITVGDNTYKLGKDFAYMGHVTQTYFDPVFSNPITKIGVSSYRATILMVDYTFDFSAFSGSIEGTLNMHAVFAEGNSKLHSLSGTGDLQNVKITGVNLPADLTNLPFVSISHSGTVMGWPDIAPLP